MYKNLLCNNTQKFKLKLPVFPLLDTTSSELEMNQWLDYIKRSEHSECIKFYKK